MRTLPLLGMVLGLVLAARSASAVDKKECLDAASDGQKLRDAHKLVEARGRFRVCANAACPGIVQSDCAGWLEGVEKSLPTVVFSAKTPSGTPLLDVKVDVDGQPFATRVEGDAVPINPGSHSFHFVAADGSTRDQLVVINEGGKNQVVAVVLGAPVAAPTPAAPLRTDGGSGEAGASGSSSSAWRTLGWVVGGVGVVGLGVATVFGVIALGDKSSAHCDANNVCDPGTTSGIKGAALASDVGWIAGGVLTAGGAALVLFAPGGSGSQGSSSVRVAPFLTASGGGVSLGRGW